MKTTKTNKNRQNKNLLSVTCAISGTTIHTGQATCASVKNNNTLYYSSEYENIFTANKTSPALANALLTCVCLGATLKTDLATLTAYKTSPDLEKLYKVYFNNNITLICSGNNAQVKKYFAQLTTYKKAIAKITYLDSKGQERQTENISEYPVYARQKHLYRIGKGYNPDSKKTIIKVW